MLNFGGITHIIANPEGHAPGYNFSFVGSVPLACLQGHKPTMSDVMGLRVQADGLAYSGRQMSTIEEAIGIARAGGANLCSSATCACRKLF
jgi:hypothetical protein